MAGKGLGDFLRQPGSTGLLGRSPRLTDEGPCPEVLRKLLARLDAPSEAMICQPTVRRERQHLDHGRGVRLADLVRVLGQQAHIDVRPSSTDHPGQRREYVQ
eukprot:2528383-Alexandrium_andersonii.AAC.1